MTTISRQALESVIREYRDPYLEKDLYELDAVNLALALHHEGARVGGECRH